MAPKNALVHHDKLVCIFKKGDNGNLFSVAPDRKTVVIDRKAVGTVLVDVAYLCEVKGVSLKADSKEPKAYIVNVLRTLQDADFTEVAGADVARGQLTLKAPLPSLFPNAVRLTVDADVEERLIRQSGAPDRVQVHLRYAHHEHTVSVTRQEAARLGIRATHFIPKPPAPLPTPAAAQPARPDPEWQPSIFDHTAYLLAPTAELLASTTASPLGLDALHSLARNRLTQILAVGAYDPVPALSKAHATLEHVVTGLARMACLTYATDEARRKLVIAERRLLTWKARGLPTNALAMLLQDASLAPTGTAVMLPVQTYLDLTPGRRDGPWALANLHVEGGCVTVPPAMAADLLAEQAARLLCSERLEVGPEAAPTLADLHAHISRTLLALARDDKHPALRGRPRYDAFPPCVRHVLHKALRQGLSEAETHLAFSFLAQLGISADEAMLLVHGRRALKADHVDLGRRTKRFRADTIKPVPCAVLKELGACSWSCGTTTPLAAYRQSQRPRKVAA